MNNKQTSNNYLSVPTINTKISSNNNIETEDIDMISDGSQSPCFSTDDNSTMSYENIQYHQSNNSSNSQFTQSSNMDMDDDSIMNEDNIDNQTNDIQYPSTTKKNDDKSMKPINNQHHNGMNMNMNNHQKHATECMEMEQAYDARVTMMQHGFKAMHRIAKTLQGETWRVYSQQLECEAVVKITNKNLSRNHLGIDHYHSKYVKGCTEDIYNEIQILNILQHPALPTEPAKPKSMISLYKVFEDPINIFVVMEDGGQDLLQFVNECHHALKQSKMYIHEWQETVKLMMRQIIEFVAWLHDVKHVCHLDISLENMLISNIEKVFDPITKTYKISPTFQIKFCDFGVAELFTKTKQQVQEETAGSSTISSDEEEEEEFYDEDEDEEDYESEEEIDLDEISFQCNKYCGKIKYECPEIFNRYSSFDARKADIWSVGVAFFMISIGTAPWQLPCDIKNNPKIPFDSQYDTIVNKRNIEGVLIPWGRHHYIDDEMKDLFQKIFSDHMYRITAEEILSHPWLDNDDEEGYDDVEFGQFNFE